MTDSMGPRGRLVACLLLVLGGAGIALADPPSVSSGTLVLQLRADAATVATNASGHVTTWTAKNNGALVLTSTGNAPQQITFSATGMNGVPTVQFTDATGNDQWLRGDLPAGVNLTDATVFWLGYYATAPDGFGNYVYSIGTSAGNGASQLSHQKQDGRVEIYNGQTTFTGADISARDDVYTVWRSEYRGGTPAVSHAAFAEGVDLGVPGNTVGYNVNPDPHPVYVGGWQGSGYNIVGNVSELLVYQGILSAADALAVECYLHSRRAGGPDAPDCNSNGVVDCVEVRTDAAPDCNGNVVPDTCDIAGGASLDANTNALPDECEIVQLSLNATNLVWVDIDAAVAVEYDVVRGGVGTLRSTGGDFTAATEACLVDDHPGASWPHGINPLAAQAYWYLVRAQLPTGPPLTYDTKSPGQSGSRDGEIGAAPSACP